MKHPSRSFRLVCGPDQIPAVEALLAAQGFAFEPEPFHPLARSLTAEPFPLGQSLAAAFGRIYIQDRSSMLPPLLLAPPTGAAVLDMCASPGSKTGLLAGLVGPTGFVLGVEPSPDRLATLRQNLRRTARVNAATAHLDSRLLPLAEASFPFILLDPPCSGWGTAEKNPKVMDLWAEGKTGPLVRLQRELLARAAAILAPGGRLLYSTCTTNQEENEDQTAYALEELGLELAPLPPPPGFLFEAPRRGLEGVLRVADEDPGQGFYLACFTKPGAAAPGPDAEPADLPGRPLRTDDLEAPACVDFSGLPPGRLQDFGGRVLFLHRQALARIPAGLKWQGHPVGRISGRIFRPEPRARFLLSAAPGPERQDLSDPALLADLLAGRSVACPKTAKGPQGLFFRGLPLGFAAAKSGRLVWSEK